MHLTNKELNYIAGFNEYQFMELKNNIDKIKKILNLNVYNYPDPKSFDTNYYFTISGNHRIIIIHDDFKHILKYTQNQKDIASNLITQLNFKFVFKNIDTLKIELDDYNSVEYFVNNENFINNFDDLNGHLWDKAVLVIYQKM
jgi:hypothetical protein